MTEPSDRRDNNNKTSKQQEEQRPSRRRRTLYCIGCDGTKKAEYLVGAKKNLPLCHEHWEVFAKVVLERRSVEEEEAWT